MTVLSPHSRALAALGHDARLLIFRLLVKCGEDGLRVGEIATNLKIAPSTLAHHLAALVDAGLVVQEKRGREVVNRANYDAMHQLVDFLTSDCCAGLVAVDEKNNAA